GPRNRRGSGAGWRGRNAPRCRRRRGKSGGRSRSWPVLGGAIRPGSFGYRAFQRLANQGFTGGALARLPGGGADHFGRVLGFVTEGNEGALRLRENITGGAGRPRPGSGGAFTGPGVEAILHLHNEALGGLAPDTGQTHQSVDVVAPHAAGEFLRGHARQDGEGHLGADTTDPDQGAEQAPL